MHMADALLSPTVGGIMAVTSIGVIAYSLNKMKVEGLEEQKIPMMGVMGAFIFAGQMINFTIPGTGSSGHIGGGILLAALLGGNPAFVTLAAVLLIQCLFFADGGLLALGCNIFNMGFFACFVGYPLIFKPILKRGINKLHIMLASTLAVVVSLQLGAFGVVLETLLSGVTELPFSAFVLLMQPIHLAIGMVEGLVTGAVLCFVHAMRPEILTGILTQQQSNKFSYRKVTAVLAVVALLVAGGVSLLASANPDGLEWAIAGITGSGELERPGDVYQNVAHIQEATSFMPDYDYKNTTSESALPGTSVAGIVGSVLTMVLTCCIGVLVLVRKKHSAKNKMV